MRIGLQIPSFTWPGGDAEIGPRLANIAKTADEAGFVSLWLMDHFFQIEMVGPPSDPMLEGYTTLGYLAALTKQARLGLMVTGVIYRHPGILAKIVSTLDVLSGGRATLGIGAAWFEREAKGLGVPYPPLAERFERLEETLQIVKQMWSDETGPYNGQHYQLAETLNQPLPLSNPHPSILIGGMGEKKTLRMVAQYADACNLFTYMGNEVLTQKLAVLKEHCEAVGRNYDDIEKTALGTVNFNEMSADDVINQCRGWAEVGIQQVILNMYDIETLKPLEIFGNEIIPAVAKF
jgi:F420-dependent oxidoreductase-like protein